MQYCHSLLWYSVLHAGVDSVAGLNTALLVFTQVVQPGLAFNSLKST